ncbi:type III pantothenate kinase, partial [Candidatus Aerophobetes bacterium]|nr:type III pantothenate kinase [Candidatus Aerophobetes bacterium]
GLVEFKGLLPFTKNNVKIATCVDHYYWRFLNMNLVIDIGNTVVKVGLFEKEKLLLRGNFSTHPYRESDEWGISLKNWLNIHLGSSIIDKVIISSVAQTALVPIKKAIPRYFKVNPVEVNYKLAGIPVLCDNPEEVGADRIANAVAIVRMYTLPAVAVDFGTATTFDVISEGGEYIGGVIAPGIRVASESLWQRAERLFPVEFRKPSFVIGKNTADNLTSGIFYGCIGMVKEILNQIEHEMGQIKSIVATGGLGEIVSSECKMISSVNPDLTLQGLNFIALDLK